MKGEAMETETAALPTPPIVDQIVSAAYHLTGIIYINGTSPIEGTRKDDAKRSLKRAKAYINKALTELDD